MAEEHVVQEKALRRFCEQVLAKLEVLQKELQTLLHDLRVIARNSGIGDHQVLVYFSAHSKGSPVQDNIFLLTALYKYKRGKYSGTGAVMAGRTNGI